MIKTLPLQIIPFIRALFTTCLFVVQMSGQDWEQQFKALPTADINIQDQFGASMAISGEYLVVGAPLSDKLNSNAGAAYVYKKENGSWTEVAELLPSDPIENQHYGQSVAIKDDVIVVGAPGLVFQLQGAAYVFVKSGPEWVDATESTKLLPNDPSDNNVFGISVAVGISEVIVGDHRSEVAGEEVGAAYVFESTDNWSSAIQVAKLTQSDPSGLNSSDDNFGGNMVYAEETLVVAARLHDLGAFDDGALYVFEKPVSGWSDDNEDAKLFPTVQDNNFEFGVSLAVEGGLICSWW